MLGNLEPNSQTPALAKLYITTRACENRCLFLFLIVFIFIKPRAWKTGPLLWIPRRLLRPCSIAYPKGCPEPVEG
jgi:hypothetical protein